MEWSQFLTSLLPLLGVIVGAFSTYLTQTHILQKQLRRESEKEREEKITERLLIYNEILKLEGEIQMLEYVGGGRAVFNLDAYVQEFRPIFYSKFHLLNQEIAYKVREMDRIIMEANFNEELEVRQNDALSSYFNQIIEEIERQIAIYVMIS